MPRPPSPPALLTKKRRKSETTQPITNFFPTLKRQRSVSENHDVSQKLEDCISLVNAEKATEDEDTQPLEYNAKELCQLLGIERKDKNDEQNLKNSLENLPEVVYAQIFTILDVKSLSSLALASKTLSEKIKTYMSANIFLLRFEFDYLDFLNTDSRYDDDDFLDKDPFYACGLLIKSMTVTMNTDKRALIFLNICRNLNLHLKKDLCGFGRILDGMTQGWSFADRRILVKAAILIDPSLHDDIVRVLMSVPGKHVGLEMKIRSRLTELFLNRNQEIDGSDPSSIIEFGSWLSILLNNFNEKYQGKLYFLLFGPSLLCRTGEKIAWNFFQDSLPNDINNLDKYTYRSKPVVRSRLTALLNGIRALRIMSSSRVDIAWKSRQIYRLFLRVVEASSDTKNWSVDTSSMALAIDTSGLLSEYLVTCCDPQRDDFELQQNDAALMICQVRAILYSWSASPSTYLSEPLHRAFSRLTRVDGIPGGHYYKSFLNKIWSAREQRLIALSEEKPMSERLIREELQGQLSTLRLLCDFQEVMIVQRRGNNNVGEEEEAFDALEQDEQWEAEL